MPDGCSAPTFVPDHPTHEWHRCVTLVAMTLTPLPANRRRSRVATAAAAAAAVALISVAAYIVTNRVASSPAASLGEAPPTITVTGTVQTRLGRTWEIGRACPSVDYDDIQPGANVTVYDRTGKVVALSTLGAGESGPHPLLEGVAVCLFPFVVTGVPTSAGPYAVEVSHRGKLRFNEADLADPLALKIG
jgi:hypothetical protein